MLRSLCNRKVKLNRLNKIKERMKGKRILMRMKIAIFNHRWRLRGIQGLRMEAELLRKKHKSI